MVMGHYATALIPYAYESNRKMAPFYVFLILTQILDFIMVALVWLGIESIEPHSFMDASFANMKVDMTYSHDILPVILITLLVGGATAALFRNWVMGLWAVGLIALHELMDLLVGFEHYWFGPGETTYGLGLYTKLPVLGIAIELVICAALLTWYLKRREAAGHQLGRGAKITLFGVLVGATAALLLMANQPLSALVSAL